MSKKNNNYNRNFEKMLEKFLKESNKKNKEVKNREKIKLEGVKKNGRNGKFKKEDREQEK